MNRASIFSDNNYELSYRIRWSNDKYVEHRNDIVECLKSNDSDVQFIILSALFKIGPIAHDLIPMVKPHVYSDDINLSQLALQVLGNIGSKNPDEIVDVVNASLDCDHLQETALRTAAFFGEKMLCLKGNIQAIAVGSKMKIRKLAIKATSKMLC